MDTMRERQPNIVFLFSDQHQAAVTGCYGDAVVRTPHLDDLAASGLVFDRAYCQSPICMPSRATLLTGRWVRDHGCRTNNESFPEPGQATVLNHLRDAGYRTAEIGKMHFYDERIASKERADVDDYHDLMTAFGFDELVETPDKFTLGSIASRYSDAIGPEISGEIRRYAAAMFNRQIPMYDARPSPADGALYIDTWVGDRAVEWIAQVDDAQPFFLWVGFPGPHHPYDAPEQYASLYSEDELPEPHLDEGTGPVPALVEQMRAYSSTIELDEAKIRRLRKYYYGNVTAIDDKIGDIVAALERRGMLDDTWIVYSSDHGEMLGEHRLLTKVVFYEPSVRVPLIVRPPGGIEARRTSAIAAHVDLAATFLDVAGALPLAGAPGRSFVGAVRGEHFEGSSTFSELRDYTAVVTDRWKLSVDGRDGNVESLHDLRDDPREDHNLAADPSYRDVVEQLTEELLTPFMRGG